MFFVFFWIVNYQVRSFFLLIRHTHLKPKEIKKEERIDLSTELQIIYTIFMCRNWKELSNKENRKKSAHKHKKEWAQTGTNERNQVCFNHLCLWRLVTVLRTIVLMRWNLRLTKCFKICTSIGWCNNWKGLFSSIKMELEFIFKFFRLLLREIVMTRYFASMHWLTIEKKKSIFI